MNTSTKDQHGGLSFALRLATQGDAEALHSLNQMFGNENDLHTLRESIASNDREIICIAIDQGQPVGYCTGLIVKSMCYRNRRVDVEALYVIEACREKGVGRLLLQSLQKEAAARSMGHLHVVTHAGNKSARSLYESEGFVSSGEILYEKDLP